MIETQDRQHEERYKNRWYGKYRAFVRDILDPERLGRCRLEIPAVLGTGRDNWSDWAWPCFPYGGNDDVGVFLVPEEGASVWAEFEGGDLQYPIWSGVWLARSNPGEQPEEAKRLCSEPACLDCGDKPVPGQRRRDEAEHKKHHGHPPYYCPRLKVLLKTETGHTIAADDRDGWEFLEIVDRAGQIFHMDCRVKREVQAGNSRRRGTRDAGRGDQLDIATDIEGQRAKIEITDLCRQYVRWDAWKDREKIHIQSCDRTRARWQKILVDTTKGREKIRLWGLCGAQEIVIDSTAGAEMIRLTDKAGQVVVMNAAAGMERIQATDKAGSVIIMDGVMGNILVRSANKVLINP